ncbi:MAG TPA: Uma2 family endonuclease [Polyangia bacterium]|nr:Uma2 family endonuclease [Polyangia bacterium]
MCEVISPSTEKIDRARKLPIYARGGVPHLWLANPIAHLLEVYELRAERWSLVGAYDKTLRVEPFCGIDLDPSEWWLPEDEPPAP